MAFSTAEGLVSMFIAARDPQLTWRELEGLLIDEYVDEGMAVEAMRNLMKLTQMKDKSTRELGVRTEKLAALAILKKLGKMLAYRPIWLTCMWRCFRTST